MRHRPLPHSARCLLGVAAAALLVGCTSGRDVTSLAPDEGETTVPDVVATQGNERRDFEGSLEVADQTTEGTTIVVDQAGVDQGRGWVAIHRDVNDAPGPVIGSAQLFASDQTDVEVTLDEPVEDDQRLWAMLYIDADPIGDFNVPGHDEPLTDERGDVVQRAFEVDVSG